MPIVFPEVDRDVAEYMLWIAAVLLLAAVALWLWGLRGRAELSKPPQYTSGANSPMVSGTTGSVTLNYYSLHERSAPVPTDNDKSENDRVASEKIGEVHSPITAPNFPRGKVSIKMTNVDISDSGGPGIYMTGDCELDADGVKMRNTKGGGLVVDNAPSDERRPRKYFSGHRFDNDKSKDD
jgi:hypothetical protein